MDILDEEIVIITLNKIPLLAGEYYLNIGIHDELAMPYMNVISAIKFKIFDTKGDMGISRIETTWKWKNMEER